MSTATITATPTSRSVRASRTARVATRGAMVGLGLYVFVPLTPAIMGPFTAGRVGIGGWMLLFALLGYGLTRLQVDDE